MMSLSLDGFMEGPDQDISWHMVDEELHTDINEYLKTTGAFLQRLPSMAKLTSTLRCLVLPTSAGRVLGSTRHRPGPRHQLGAR